MTPDGVIFFLSNRGQRSAHLKAALLGLALLLLLALLGHSPRQLMQQGLCNHIHPPCPRVLGLHIHKVRVHAQRQVTWQSPADTHGHVSLQAGTQSPGARTKPIYMAKSLHACRIMPGGELMHKVWVKRQRQSTWQRSACIQRNISWYDSAMIKQDVACACCQDPTLCAKQGHNVK